MFEIFAYNEIAYAVRESAISVLKLSSEARSFKLNPVEAILAMFCLFKSKFLASASLCWIKFSLLEIRLKFAWCSACLKSSENLEFLEWIDMITVYFVATCVGALISDSFWATCEAISVCGIMTKDEI